MDTTTLIIAAVTFFIGHMQLIPKLLGLQPKPAVPPSTFGHGELLKYLEQLLVNAMAQVQPSPTPSPVPNGQVDINALLQALVALLEKQLVPTPKG